jgi:hypothetical protein
MESYMLKQNIGIPGRLTRFILGLILLIAAYLYSSWILLAFSLFCFFQALMGWCAFHQLLGKNSCPIKKNKD